MALFIVAVAKLVDARDCGSRNCGFDSHLSPHLHLNELSLISKTSVSKTEETGAEPVARDFS